MHQELLTNGIHVLLYPLRDVKSVSVNVFAKGGSLMEDPAKNGLAHFMEHMLLQGTPTYPTAQAIAQYVESLAGSHNAYTNDREISFYVHLPYTAVKEAITLAHEIWFESLFPGESFAKEQRAVLSEAGQKLDSLGYKIGKFAREKRFISGSKMQQYAIGTPDTITKVTHEDILNFWKTYFTTDNTYLLIVGNIDIDTVKTLIDQTFGSEKKTEAPVLFDHLAMNQYADLPIALRSDATLQTNYFELSFPSIPLESPRSVSATQGIGLVILGMLRSSRLQKTLRYDKGLVYGAYASFTPFPHMGDVSISSEMRDEQFYEAVGLMTSLTKDFIAQGPTDEELAHAKQFLISQNLMAFDELSSVVNWFSNELLWKEKVLVPEDVIALITDVKKQEINELMHTKWDLSKTQITQQGPLADDEKLRDFLKQQREQIIAGT